MNTQQIINHALQLTSSQRFAIIDTLLNSLNEFDNHAEELKKAETEFLAETLKAIDWQQAKKELRAQFE